MKRWWSLALGILVLCPPRATADSPPRADAGKAPAAARQASQSESPAPATRALPPASNLRIAAPTAPSAASDLLDPAAVAWSAAPPTLVLLNRTPRVYPTEPTTDWPVPDLEVRAFRSAGKLTVRLRWSDDTASTPQPPPRRTGTAGDPEQLYKQPSGEVSAFADAAGIMFPRQWNGPAFPSLQMGDLQTPVLIHYWNASRGAEDLVATGRTTPQPAGSTFPHRAAHADGHWTLTAELPDRPDGYPLAFALWDGAHQDRDGLKFFSIWYVLTTN